MPHELDKTIIQLPNVTLPLTGTEAIPLFQNEETKQVLVSDLAVAGAEGPEGPQGLQGDIGPEGPQGLQGDIGPDSPVTKTVYVDANRTDSYTEEGTFAKPFKTLAPAIAVSPEQIILSSGSYDADALTFTGAAINGIGCGKTTITGDLTLSGCNKNMEKVSFSGDLAVSTPCSFRNCFLTGTLTLSAGASQLINTHIIVENKNALVVSSTGGITVILATLSTTGDYSAVVVNTSGTALLSNVKVATSSATIPAVEVQAGSLNICGSQLFNDGGGESLLASGGTMIGVSDIMHVGNLNFGAVSTVMNMVFAPTASAVLGTAILQRPVSRVVAVPSTATSTGTIGQVAYDADYFYVCVDTDTWVRAELVTW